MTWRSLQKTVTTATVAGAIGLVTWLAGLWVLIVPTMALFTAVLVAVATASAWARRLWADKS